MQVPVRVVCEGRELSDSVKLECRTKQQRSWHAFRSLFRWWLLALFSVLIPVAHFVLVPLFLLLGLIFSVRTFLQSEVLSESRVECPKCGKKFEIVTLTARFPIFDICKECEAQVRIERT